MNFADDLAQWRHARSGTDRPHPHVHRCTECYEDEACGLACTTEPDEDRPDVRRGGHCVCGLCAARARKAGGQHPANTGACDPEDGTCCGACAAAYSEPDPDPSENEEEAETV